MPLRSPYGNLKITSDSTHIENRKFLTLLTAESVTLVYKNSQPADSCSARQEPFAASW